MLFRSYFRDHLRNENGKGFRHLNGQELKLLSHLVYDFRDRGVANAVGYDSQLIEYMTDQLNRAIQNQDQNGSYEYGALIDEIIRIIGTPFSRNILNENMIIQLKKALLLPSDLNKLKATLDKTELHCAACRRGLVSGEMVTYHHDNNNDGRASQPVLYCVTCSNPEICVCSVCGETSKMTRPFITALKKQVKCLRCLEDHGKRPAKPDIPITVFTDPPGLNVRPGARNTRAWRDAINRIPYTPAPEVEVIELNNPFGGTTVVNRANTPPAPPQPPAPRRRTEDEE